MRLLLDTHIILWALVDSPKLPAAARRAIADASNAVFYSPVSLWEVAIEHGMHPDSMLIGAGELRRLCEDSGYSELPLAAAHVGHVENLARDPDLPRHQDPFDRMLIAQAKAEGMFLVSHDKRIAEYDEPCVLRV